MASPKKILLFGKTGDGKSTVGNMLIHGSLKRPRNGRDLAFTMGDGMEGVTDTCVQASGRGYDVVDTVGLGEQTESERKQAVQLIYNFLVKTQRLRAYSHILFVREAGRFNELDRDIWNIFLEVFGGCEPAFVLVLTKANNPAQWMEDNSRQLDNRYPECNRRYVCVTFPPIDSDPQVETILERRRRSSLEELDLRLRQFSAFNRDFSFPLAYAQERPQQLTVRSKSIWASIQQMASRYLNPVNLYRALFGRNTRNMVEYQRYA